MYAGAIKIDGDIYYIFQIRAVKREHIFHREMGDAVSILFNRPKSKVSVEIGQISDTSDIGQTLVLDLEQEKIWYKTHLFGFFRKSENEYRQSCC